MALFEIQVSGRIPKYFFGTLMKEFRDELSLAVELCKGENVEDENDFLNLIFNLPMDGPGNHVEELFNEISREDLAKLPNFNRVVNEYIEEEFGHYIMMEALFNYPEYRSLGYGTFTGISLFEDDATIAVYDYDGNEVMSETSLSDFMEGDGGGNTDEIEEGDDGYEDLLKIRKIKDVNPDFGFSTGDSEYTHWNINEHGCKFVDDELEYPGLVKFDNENGREYGVTIYFDDITTWSFMVETGDEEFDFSKITFVGYPGSHEFRGNDVAFSHVFYREELLDMEENWHRDKGIELKYGESRGLERLDFFLYR